MPNTENSPASIGSPLKSPYWQLTDDERSRLPEEALPHDGELVLSRINQGRDLARLTLGGGSPRRKKPGLLEHSEYVYHDSVSCLLSAAADEGLDPKEVVAYALDDVQALLRDAELEHVALARSAPEHDFSDARGAQEFDEYHIGTVRSSDGGPQSTAIPQVAPSATSDERSVHQEAPAAIASAVENLARQAVQEGGPGGAAMVRDLAQAYQAVARGPAEQRGCRAHTQS